MPITESTTSRIRRWASAGLLVAGTAATLAVTGLANAQPAPKPAQEAPRQFTCRVNDWSEAAAKAKCAASLSESIMKYADGRAPTCEEFPYLSAFVSVTWPGGVKEYTAEGSISCAVGPWPEYVPPDFGKPEFPTLRPGHRT